ncbi:MAG: hypothetical protein HFH68_05180 [Lachnospiraceae bacterium]|nr:hypothetical protein [Lachnospiraceae bacterium]
MKNKVLTIASIIMMFLPWTILPVRMNEWALKSPVAEKIIMGYALFMIFSGVFTIVSYFVEKVQNVLMKACLVINTVYAAAGIIFLSMM